MNKSPVYENIAGYAHPEVDDADKIVFIVGVEGPNPVSFVRICTEENVGQWTDHRLAHAVDPGEVMVIEQPNWFPVRRLCAYSKDRYENYVGTHTVSTLVNPGEEGAGIYYLGTVKTPDSVSAFTLDELYDPNIVESIKVELEKAINSYPHLKTINFELD